MMYSLNALKGIKDAPDEEIYCEKCKFKVKNELYGYVKKKDRGKIGWPKKI